MMLIQFVERYIASRDVSKLYCNSLRKRAGALTDFCNGAAMQEVLTEENVNRFLSSLNLNPRTVRSYRTDIISLWNGAADLDLVEYPVMRRIRRPKCPQLVIECYSIEEVRAILKQAALCHKYIMRTGLNRRVYWPAIIRLAWDTGLRRGDCWAFHKSWIRPDGSARVVQRKTQKIVTVRLHQSTIDALNEIPFDQACRWPGELANSHRFCKQFKSIRDAAGVTRGSFKWLRRASGSYVELDHIGAGSKHLGHADSRIFDKHYDARLGDHLLPLPPDLDAS